jgi:serine/threonine-protein kinase
VIVDQSASLRDASWDFEEGDEIVRGRFAVTLLGGGERSEAWLAWDEKLYTLVVAKLVRPNLLEDEHTLAALEREATALSRLAHPSIVRCFDAVLQGPRPHLLLESIDGPRLSTLIRRFGPLTPEQLVPLAIEIGSALHFMHGAGYIHLDVKPRNLIMGATPKLIDLGIARTTSEMLAIRYPLGTDAYMAPEQTSSETVASAGAPADVWGLAATLYEAAEGRRPFGDHSERTEQFPQLTRSIEPFRRGMPLAIEAVIRRGLERDPSDRPALTEIVATFEELLAAARGAARRGLRRRLR